MPKLDNEVPSIKLSKEQIGFAKQFKKMMTMRDALSKGLMTKMAGARNMQNMLAQVNTAMGSLVQKVPMSTLERMDRQPEVGGQGTSPQGGSQGGGMNPMMQSLQQEQGQMQGPGQGGGY